MSSSSVVTTIVDGNESLALCASLLKQDKVVAFPTETVYGLGANALSSEAVAKIFLAKGRRFDCIRKNWCCDAH